MVNDWGTEFIDENRVLGVGGMATVHLVRNKKTEKLHAAKVPRSDAGDPERQLRFDKQFKQECRIHPKLEHPNIVKCSVADAPVPFLLLDYIEGKDLKEYLNEDINQNDKLQDEERHKRMMDEIVNLIGNISGALNEVHKTGWLHCDIKPSNILRDKKGIYYLTDFGIAHHQNFINPVRLGTPKYMAPEQHDHELGKITSSTDVYSFATTIYEVMAGRAPFTEPKDSLSIEEQIRYIKPPSVGYFNPRISLVVNDVLAQALSKDQSDRFDTINAFAKALLDALKDEGEHEADLPPAGTILTWEDKSFLILKSEIMIGRLETDCDIHLGNDRMISRRHALLEWSKENHAFKVWHQGWARPTRVNGNPVMNEKYKLLKDGSMLTINNTNFLLKIGS